MTVAAALADTPVLLLLALMASASRRALLVLPSVAITVLLMLSEPGDRPLLRMFRAPPLRPKVPPVTEPSEKLMVVLAPRPTEALVVL